MHLLILVPLFIAAFIAGCIFAFVVHELRQGLKRRRVSRVKDDFYCCLDDSPELAESFARSGR